MMTSDQYPEHLNPFAEDVKPKSTGLKLVHSFKEFTNTIRRSFRGRSKIHLEDRFHRSDNDESRAKLRRSFINGNETVIHKCCCDSHIPQHHRHTITSPSSSILNQHSAATVALPRSRFQERIQKSPKPDEPSVSHLYGVQSPNCMPSNSSLNENDENGNAITTKEMVINQPQMKPIRRRRKKRTAPLPPLRGSVSSQNVSMGTKLLDNHSKWSLNSIEVDTVSDLSQSNLSIIQDHTIDADDKDSSINERIADNKNENNDSILDELSTFNRNMATLNDDSDNKNNNSSEMNDNNMPQNDNDENIIAIPDVVISCASGEDEANIESDNIANSQVEDYNTKYDKEDVVLREDNLDKHSTDCDADEDDDDDNDDDKEVKTFKKQCSIYLAGSDDETKSIESIEDILEKCDEADEDTIEKPEDTSSEKIQTPTEDTNNITSIESSKLEANETGKADEVTQMK